MKLPAGLLALMALAAGTELAAQPPVSVPLASAAPTNHAQISPCLGAGYIAYSYPGVDTCPCAYDGCYPPARYYCGGEVYRKHWLRKWLKAHFCGGSMLDDYPCHCVFPTTGKAWLPAVPRSGSRPQVLPDTEAPVDQESVD